MTSISCVYTITCLVNNKMYVGCAINFVQRRGSHIRALEKGVHKNSHLQTAWSKYGGTMFKFEILEEYDQQLLFSQEHYWCNLLNVHDPNIGYNIKPTNPIGKCMIAKETRLKLRLSRLNKASYVRSDEFKIKMRDIKLNTSQETKNKISQSLKNYFKENQSANIGRDVSDDLRKLRSEIQKGKIGYWAGKRRSYEDIIKMNCNRNPIIHIPSNIQFGSLYEACRVLNLTYCNEYKKMKKSINLIFKYVKE